MTPGEEEAMYAGLTEEAKMELDQRRFGTSFEKDGKRVDPRSVEPSEPWCPDCKRAVSSHEMFDPPRCPVIRINWRLSDLFPPEMIS